MSEQNSLPSERQREAGREREAEVKREVQRERERDGGEWHRVGRFLECSRRVMRGTNYGRG
jgi:hypothetical protein